MTLEETAQAIYCGFLLVIFIPLALLLAAVVLGMGWLMVDAIWSVIL